MCQIGQKREKKGDRFEFERNNVSNNAVNGLGHCVYRSNQEKKHSHFHLCIPRRQTIREKHVTVTVTVFFHSWQQQKKIWRKKNAANFFRLLILKANCWRQQRCSRKKRHDKTAGETKRNEWTINYGWNELNIGNKPLCVVSLPSYAVTVLTDGDRRRATAPVQQWNVERIIVGLSLIRRWYALY